MVTSSQARQIAEREVRARLASQPDEFRQAARGSEPAEALLVERLDQPDRSYYLVPFARDGETTLIVIVDARTGRFERTTALRPPGVYPAVDVDRARALLAARLADRDTASMTSQLVWKPSHQSQSPYEPLWRLRTNGQAWYVDQSGEVWDEIEEPRLKGGGPPGG